MPSLYFTSLLGDLLSHLREGRFQASMAGIAALAGLLSGLEVTTEHYRGSYNQKIMWSPIVFSFLLAATGLAAVFSPWIACFLLPVAGGLLIADGMIGFGFHLRGIARKPGGWRKNVITNIVMGPPLFAPLLLGLGGVLAILASLLLPEHSAAALPPERMETLRRSFAGAAFLSALLNGFEVLYSHYQGRFAYAAQWIPIVLTPLLIAADGAAIVWPHHASFLIGISLLAILAGMIGTAFHLRGTWRLPGGRRQWLYKFIYGPPAFAPLLFAATGFLGLLAAAMATPR